MTTPTQQPSDFWAALDQLTAVCPLVIDRPKGSAHPRYPDFIYPLDYGYLAGSASPDGDGIDLWRGTDADAHVNAVICTVDLLKRDSEIKILIGCTEAEQAMLLRFHNDSPYMKGVLMKRPQ